MVADFWLWLGDRPCELFVAGARDCTTAGVLGAGEPSKREGVGGSRVAKDGEWADGCARGAGSPLDPAGRDRRAGEEEETGLPVKSVSPGFLDFVGVWIDTLGPAGVVVVMAPVAVVLSLDTR